jgi:hypothetical protein
LLIDPAKMAVLTSIGSPRFNFAFGFANGSLNHLGWSPIKIVITGFNTDIERDGVVYHVQTEDKGLDSPLILSLVYSGGEILAAKRTPYDDLIVAGFDDEVLAERLKRQHRLICAAINAGRIEELKRMGSRTERVGAVTSEPVVDVAQPSTVSAASLTDTPAQSIPDEFILETSAWRPPVNDWVPPVAEVVAEIEVAPIAAGVPSDNDTLPTLASATLPESAYTVYDPRRQALPGRSAKAKAGLVLSVLDEEELRAGENVTIRVLLQRCLGSEEKPLRGVVVSVKVLGTAFRPRIYSVKTQRDGVAVVPVEIPSFTSGRAALLIRAEANDESSELRRVIHPAD